MATKLELAIARAVELESQVVTLTTEAAEHRAHAAKMEKERDSQKGTADSWYKQMTEAKDEVAQVHGLLDAMPNPAPRKAAAADTYSSEVKFSLMTRLAAWLAMRAA